MKAQRGSTVLFNLGASWGWVVKDTSLPLYRRERDEVPSIWEAGWVWKSAENGKEYVQVTLANVLELHRTDLL